MQVYTSTSISNNLYADSELITHELDRFELGMRNQFTQNHMFKELLISYTFRMKRSFMYKYKHRDRLILSRCIRYT